MADAAKGSASSQTDRPDKILPRPQYVIETPQTIAVRASTRALLSVSPRRSTARSTANTGVMLLTAPAMFGPIRRLDSKLSRATAPGKNSPMQPKRTAAAKFADPRATKNGAAHQKSSVEEGMLHAAPS